MQVREMARYNKNGRLKGQVLYNNGNKHIMTRYDLSVIIRSELGMGKRGQTVRSESLEKIYKKFGMVF